MPACTREYVRGESARFVFGSRIVGDECVHAQGGPKARTQACALAGACRLAKPAVKGYALLCVIASSSQSTFLVGLLLHLCEVSAPYICVTSRKQPKPLHVTRDDNHTVQNLAYSLHCDTAGRCLLLLSQRLKV